jgi:hypothetical protein
MPSLPLPYLKNCRRPEITSIKPTAVMVVLIILILHLIPCSAESDSTLSVEEMKARIAFIKSELDNNRNRAQLWWYGWVSIMTGVTTFSYLMSTTDFAEDPDNRRVAYFQINAARAGIGLVDQLTFSQFSPAYSNRKFKSMEENSPDQIKIKLEHAELLLEKNARVAKRGKSWKKKALAYTVHASCAGLVWYKEGFMYGLATFATGIVGTELIAFTQPINSVRSWENYQDKFYKSQSLYKPAQKWQWCLLLYPGMIKANFYF